MASAESLRTKIGPKSRVQPRFVGKRRKSTRARSTPTFLRILLACACWTRELTRIRTISPSATCLTISPYTHGMGGNLRGQSLALCGQASQVAACRSHSAGMRLSGESVSEEPVLDTVVRVGAAVAQERPVAAHFLDAGEVHLGNDELFGLAGLRHHDAEGIADERVSPELDACPLAIEPLEANAIHGRDPAAVCDRVAALDRLPGIELLRSILLLLGGMPADRGGIEKDVCALQCGEPGAFRIPLVPANERANRTDLRVERAKAKIAGGEIELLVIRGIIRDVHLPVDTFDLPIGVDDGRGVVIQAGRAALEQRCDHHDAGVARDTPELLSARPGDRFGEIEQCVIFALAAVLCAEELRQANKTGALPRRFFDARHRLGEIRLWIGTHAHLYETDLELRRQGRCHDA